MSATHQTTRPCRAPDCDAPGDVGGYCSPECLDAYLAERTRRRLDALAHSDLMDVTRRYGVTEVIGTGGGHNALSRTLADGRVVLVTDDDGAVPQPGARWVVGVYADGELDAAPLDWDEPETPEQLAAFLTRVMGPGARRAARARGRVRSVQSLRVTVRRGRRLLRAVRGGAVMMTSAERIWSVRLHAVDYGDGRWHDVGDGVVLCCDCAAEPPDGVQLRVAGDPHGGACDVCERDEEGEP